MERLRGLSRASWVIALVVVGLWVSACGSGDEADSGCNSNADCADPAAPWCNGETRACSPPPVAGAIGWGDGTSESVGLTFVQGATSSLQATGLEFNPMRPEELWVVERPHESDEPCEEFNATTAGCGALEGTVSIITNPGQESSTSKRMKDGNSWHFMRRPAGLAFGEGDTFATCGEARTGNYLDDTANYMGPTLWSSDPEVFAQDPGNDASGFPLNGSHLDMLHATPWCMGIAHEVGNAYWTFNGDVGALDRYDFNEDHGPGYDDHSDGEIKRYAVGELKREPGVPSGMFFHQESGKLYVADTGNKRVVVLDPSTGSAAGAVEVFEPYASNDLIEGASLTEFISPGTIEKPSGLLHHDGIVYVSDNATGVIHAFDMEGNAVRTLQTALTDGALSAMTIGPDGKMYLASLTNGVVVRIDPESAAE